MPDTYSQGTVNSLSDILLSQRLITKEQDDEIKVKSASQGKSEEEEMAELLIDIIFS